MGKDKDGGKGGEGGSDTGPRLSRVGAARRAERQERSAEALRDNLRKRKEQARGRAENDPGAAD